MTAAGKGCAMSKASTSSSISTAADVKAAKPRLKALCDAENISYAGVVERPS